MSESMRLTGRKGGFLMQTIVFKCGGSIVDELPESFFKMLGSLKESHGIVPVIVHGGGPMISSKLEQLNVTSTFVDGLRVTTNEVLDVVEMVLSGAVNKQIVRKLSSYNDKVMGVSGVDGGLLKAVPVKKASQIGYVGEVTDVNHDFLTTLTTQGYIPVISPLALGDDAQRYNVNADMAAAAIAESLAAPLLFISDIPGVKQDGHVLHHLCPKEIKTLIESGTIYGGMIPKVQSALAALEKGVPEVAIISGLDEAAVHQFIKGEAVGTRITLSEVSYV
jgi:acetylglutamate kinase